MIIPNIRIYDGGTFRCHVHRPRGQTATESVNVMLDGSVKWMWRVLSG